MSLELSPSATEIAPLTPPTTVARVLHLINGEHYSGAERVQDLLAARLPDLGFHVGFACVKPDKFPKLRKTKSAPLAELRMSSKFDLRAIWRLVNLIRSEKYDLLHCHTPRTAMLGALAAPLANTPMIYHVHSPTARDSTRALQNWFNTHAERLSLRNVARLITVSRSLSAHMQQEGFGEEMISVVPNGVPIRHSLAPRTAPTGEWTLGMVALFRPRKGIEVLLDALALLRGRGRQVRLRAVGPFETTQYEREIKDRTARLNLEAAVDWTGFTSDVNAELDQMDLFVLPSLFGEGLPMVVLEAMAAGVPIVATRVEGTPEAVRDGVDGVLADAGSVEDLAQAIESILSGQLNWSELRENALRRQADRFSDFSMARGVAAAYDVVLGSKKPATA